MKGTLLESIFTFEMIGQLLVLATIAAELRSRRNTLPATGPVRNKRYGTQLETQVFRPIRPNSPAQFVFRHGYNYTVKYPLGTRLRQWSVHVSLKIMIMTEKGLFLLSHPD